MERFGDTLKHERERRGISIEAIAEQTKVSARYLRALEEDRFAELPGGVFNRGIVRSYVRSLELEENEWVARYTVAYESSGNLKDDDADWISFASSVASSRNAEQRPETRLRWAGVILLLLVLAGLGWLVWRYVHQHAVPLSTGSVIASPANPTVPRSLPRIAASNPLTPIR